jgi:hypothetical protein
MESIVETEHEFIHEVADDPLAKFRAEVASEKAEPRGKMSDAALLKLRAQREQDTADAIVNERFGNALRSVVVTPENLRRLIERCNASVPPTPATLDRMAHKLEWWITAGYFLGREIDSAMLINLVSNLSPDEIKMTDTKFASMWNFKDAAKRTQSRLSRGIVAPEEPAFRPCKSGKKCMRFEKRKPAPASGRGEYCSTACAASARARQKRALAGMPSDTIQ